MLQIKVEATSANVCVGFDVLGISLKLYNTFTFKKSDDFSFVGFLDEYSNTNNNMVYDSYSYVFKTLNKEIIPVEIGFSGDIPVSRGLGSSSSLIVAGVFAANYMLNNPLSKDECFTICAKLEGHPDNVAPAIYGGLIASFKDDLGYHPIRYEVSNKLKFITIIPPFKLKTEDARGVLPKMLEYKDIVNNLSRIVNIPYAFKLGDIKLIKQLFNDKLHEPYRKKLIKGYDEIKEAIKDLDVALAISGSGSTMLLISYDTSVIEKIKFLNYDIKVLEVGSGINIKEV